MNVTDLDLQILRIFNHPTSFGLDILVVTLVFLVYGFLIILVYHYFRKNDIKKFSHLVATAIIGYLLVTTLKYVVARERPYLDESIVPVITKPADPYSFPSGHSFIAFLLISFLPSSWPKHIKYLAIAYIIFIPIASMYIGVHYPSDVFAGAIIGIILPKIFSESVSIKIFERFSSFVKLFLSKLNFR